MTYIAGGNIEANDYNTFATSTASVNEVFADLHPGAATIAAGADFGYGQTALVSVPVGGTIYAGEWLALFNAMRASGTHQGTTVVPPLPAAGSLLDPATGKVITAFNTPVTLASVIALLRTNRLALAASQTSLIAGSNLVQPAGTPWTSRLTFTYTVDFGSWNNARYFFNSGGTVNLNGSMAPLVTPEDTQWSTMLSNMSPLTMNYTATSPRVGTGGQPIGFYDLTTTAQSVYKTLFGGGGPYSTSFIEVTARLVAAAGTNGQIQFVVTMVDNDAGTMKTPKNGTTTYRVDNARSSGAIVYPGPALGVTNQGFVSAAL